MTEVAREHLKDIQEQKRIANQAFKKKTHNGNGGCKLSTDNMTNAEIKAKNGSVVVYKTGVPITYEEFKTYPKDVQQKYITDLQSRFGVSINSIAVDMFGISAGTLYPYLNRRKISYKKNAQGVKDSCDKARWNEWLNKKKEERPKLPVSSKVTIQKREELPTFTEPTADVATTAELITEVVNSFCPPDPDPEPTPGAPVPQTFVLSLKGSTDEPVTVEYLATVLRSIYGDKITATVDVRVYKKGSEV